MAEHTGIGWTDHTWSPWWGCTKVSPGCDHCYAEALDKRTGGRHWGPDAPRRWLSDAHWRQPLKWDRAARLAGVRRRVFPSMCDPFDNEVDATWRWRFIDLIAATPWLDWLLLTKRIGNAKAMLGDTGLPNLWLGATVVNQEEADRDIPKLLATPAALRFVSYEPALGAIRFDSLSFREGFERHDGEWTLTHNALTGFRATSPYSAVEGPRLDWLIIGGESGPHRRPFAVAWLESVHAQCAEAGVPLYVKQDAALRPGQQGRIPDHLWVQQMPRAPR